MSQPATYVRQYNFTQFSTLFPSLQQPGANLDAEFSTIKVTTDGINANLKLIQRDDGALANVSVGFDQLKTEVTAGAGPVRPWLTATNYVVNDFVVVSSARVYRCLIAHTSGVFNTDLTALKWVLIFDMTTALATTGTFFSGTFTGNGATVAYNLGYDIGSAERVIWSENGVLKIPGVDYTISGQVVTRTVAPANLSAIAWRLLGSITTFPTGTGSVSTTMLADGSVTAVKLASSAVTTAKLAANAVTNAKLDVMATLTLKGNITGGSAAPTDNTITQTLDAMAGATAGSLLVRDPTLGWVILPPGASNATLTANGTGAIPFWAPALTTSAYVPFAQYNLR
jgi:hypothetical protein